MKFKKPHDTMRWPEYLDQAQMSKLIRASRNCREMAVLTPFCTTGVRLGELVNIDIKDLDLERKNIRVRHCRTDKPREVPVSEQLEQVLKMYLSIIPADPIKNPDPLFRSAPGERIAGRTVHTIVKQCAERAGLAGVHAHVLRHSFATAWVDNGGDVFHLQDVLGHADIKMTERYWHLNTSAKKNVFAKAVPKLQCSRRRRCPVCRKR